MPRLAYQDPEAGLRFLCDAFGFTETARFAHAGSIVHAEIALNGETVFAVGPVSEHVHSPQTLGGNTVQLFCYVDDVDAHCEQSRSHGASITAEPSDQFWGDRSYDALDCAGYRWTFRRIVKEVPLDDLLARSREAAGR
jgi:uncharacterized glyoxalase superfamily protein PhnB